MRRRAWVAVGGVLTALLVVGVAAVVWVAIEWPGESAPTSLVSSRTTETSVQVYRLTSPVLYLNLGRNVEVKVVEGVEGTISVTRTLVWTQYGRPNVTEEWNGRRLRATIDCQPDALRREKDACQATYTLRVPASTDVRGLGSPTGDSGPDPGQERTE
ncbi:hypothetical protein [Streptosporangium sp. KLBMP 9127]|nr:hypothetical protein [Streptosporangium sp. KLBMP 9127]